MSTEKDGYHHGNLREKLLEAAETLLESQGVAELSLRTVAKSAGVSHAAPYRHFESKHHLLFALVELASQRLADEIGACETAFPDDPKAQLMAAGKAYVRRATQSPEMTNLMFGGLPKGEELPERSPCAFENLLRIIRNGQEAGLYPEPDTLRLAITAWSMVHGLAELIATGSLAQMGISAAEIDTLCENTCGFLFTGILNPPIQ